MANDQNQTASEREAHWVFGQTESGELSWCAVMYSPSEDSIAEWRSIAGCHLQQAWMFKKSDGKRIIGRSDDEMDQIYERWGRGVRTSRERYLEENLKYLIQQLDRVSLPNDEGLSEALFNAKVALGD
jgi:uncharacterized membrane protein